jgi:hypothetical protein
MNGVEVWADGKATGLKAGRVLAPNAALEVDLTHSGPSMTVRHGASR